MHAAVLRRLAVVYAHMGVVDGAVQWLLQQSASVSSSSSVMMDVDGGPNSIQDGAWTCRRWLCGQVVPWLLVGRAVDAHMQADTNSAAGAFTHMLLSASLLCCMFTVGFVFIIVRVRCGRI